MVTQVLALAYVQCYTQLKFRTIRLDSYLQLSVGFEYENDPNETTNAVNWLEAMTSNTGKSWYPGETDKTLKLTIVMFIIGLNLQ